MQGKNYIIILVSTLSVVLLCIVIWGVYSIFFSGSALIKIPLSGNIFIAKNADMGTSQIGLFDEYLSYMSNSGYKYLPEERMGGILRFEKNGVKVDVLYPKFIKINYGYVDKGNSD